MFNPPSTGRFFDALWRLVRDIPRMVWSPPAAAKFIALVCLLGILFLPHSDPAHADGFPVRALQALHEVCIAGFVAYFIAAFVDKDLKTELLEQIVEPAVARITMQGYPPSFQQQVGELLKNGPRRRALSIEITIRPLPDYMRVDGYKPTAGDHLYCVTTEVESQLHNAADTTASVAFLISVDHSPFASRARSTIESFEVRPRAAYLKQPNLTAYTYTRGISPETELSRDKNCTFLRKQMQVPRSDDPRTNYVLVRGAFSEPMYLESIGVNHFVTIYPLTGLWVRFKCENLPNPEQFRIDLILPQIGARRVVSLQQMVPWEDEDLSLFQQQRIDFVFYRDDGVGA